MKHVCCSHAISISIIILSYCLQAKGLLENSFPRVSCKAIDVIFRTCNYNFAATFRHISAINSSGEGPGQFHIIPKNVKMFIKADRPKKQFEVNDKELLSELEDIPELNTKRGHTKAQTLRKKLDLSIIDLTTIDSESDEEKEEVRECLCCFCDYPLSSLKQCSAGAGHLVCTSCIERYVSEQLDGNGSTNFQFIASDECICQYSQAFLDGVLSPKLRKRVDEVVFQQQVSEAHQKAGGYWKCPKCAHIGYTDKKYTLIHCPECKINYCTSCNEEDHCMQTARKR